MAYYGLKYIGRFDSFKQDPSMEFVVQIAQKDYYGIETEIVLTGTPAIHEWQDDERNKPIKGSSLKIGIVNNGIVSLESFYSNYDDEYQVILRQNSNDQILFIGFIVQDDCSEVITDITHEISITATDMLGNLKDVNLLDASLNHGLLTDFNGITFNALDSISLNTNDNRVANIKPNQTIYINNGLFQGTYVVLDVTYNLLTGYKLLFGITTFTPFTSDTCDCSWRVPTDLTILRPLSELIRLCLQSTNLELGTKAISLIFPSGSTVERWLDGTYILPTTFLNGSNWDNCYNVLEKILERFNATLFQSKGFWWIVRTDELFIGIQSTSNYYYGYEYDSEMSYFGVINSSDYFRTYTFNDFENGSLKSIERPIGYAMETFNYRQPDELLKNSNLQTLGALLDINTTGSGTSLVTEYEYQNDFWYPWDDNPTPTPDVRIRVRKDYLGQEIERYLTINGSAYSDSFAKMSNGIQLQKGDIITWSFSIRTEVSQPGPINLYFVARLRNCVDDDLYMNQDGLFGDSTHLIWFTVEGGLISPDNLNEWHEVSVTSVPLPMDGIMNVFLNLPIVKANYKDIRFEIKRVQDNLGIVNGHTHKYLNTIQIKNVLENEIYIDNSPSAAIAGTLFRDNYTGCITNLAKEWSYIGLLQVFPNLGKLVNFERMLLKYRSLYKYEGNLLNIYLPFSANYLTGMETLFIINANPEYAERYVFGKLAIDYKNGTADCTMYNIGQYSSDYMNIINNYIYQFNYLYENN